MSGLSHRAAIDTMRETMTVPVETLRDIRDRVLPMFEVAADQYRYRVPRGYPVVIDTPDQGLVGFELDPSFSLHFTASSDGLFAEMYRRVHRIDNRAGANYQKYGGLPVSDRRPLPADVTDQHLRNLIAELMSHFNQQQSILYITDD